MRFYLFYGCCVLALSTLLNFSSQAMENEKYEEEQSALIIQPAVSTVNNLDNSQEDNQLKIKDLRGFQSFYKTIITDENWKSVRQTLDKASKIVTSSDNTNHLFDNYTSVDQAYFLLYKDLLKNPEKVKKFKAQEKKFLEPLCNYVAALDTLLDNIKAGYPRNGQDYDSLQKEILPSIQATFNLYMQAYELFTGNLTSCLGNLNYEKVIRGSKVHLFYKRDPFGFLVFIAEQKSMHRIDENLFEKPIPYKNPQIEVYANSILFSFDQNNKPVVEAKSGLMFRRSDFLLNSNDNSIFVTPYCGRDDESIPFSMRGTLALTPAEEISSFRQKMETADTNNKSNSVVNVIGKKASQVFEDQVSPESLNFFYNFGDALLGTRSSAFLPYPLDVVEWLEAEYLFLKDLEKKIGRAGSDTPESAYLLRYFQESYSNQRPEEVIEGYEKALLGAYEDAELKAYEEQVLKEQEQVREKVARDEHYTKSGKGHKKKQKDKKPPQNKKLSDKANASESIEKKNKIVNERAQKRLSNLKEQAETTTKPKKFRKFLSMVNMVTQELARNQIQVEAELNKSSHGSIVVEDKEPITVVRPHGLHNTVSRKNAKGILTGLLNSYMESVTKKDF